MCWSIERWGELEEIRKKLEAEREKVVKALLDSLPERLEEPHGRVPAHEKSFN